MLMMRKDEMDPTEITPHLCLVHVVCKIIFFFYTNVFANANQRTTWPIQIHCWIQGQSLYLTKIFSLKKKQQIPNCRKSTSKRRKLTEASVHISH